MREILFRGKAERDNLFYNDGVWKKGEWQYGDYQHYYDSEGILHTEISVWGVIGGSVIPETVGQYTGLTDKNGKKIFEGDIVNFKTTAYHFKNCRIKYQSCYARYCAIDNKWYEYPMDKTFEYEVIGNIHDNPELLEGGDTNA